MVDVSGYYFIDGIDLWTAFNLFIEKGSADLLQYAPKKDSITHDWQDSNGIDVDLSRIFLKERQIILNCAIITESESDFMAKHDSFLATMLQPGTRRLTVTAHGERSYNVFYKECNGYTQVSSLKGMEDEHLVAMRFSLVLIEPEPEVDSSLVFIVDEDGRFLVT